LAEPVKEPVKNQPQKVIPVKKKNPFKGLILPLIILLLLSLATSVWLFREHFGETETDNKEQLVKRNKVELRLQDYITNAPSDTLYLGSVFGGSIPLTDSIYINRPVLYLKGPVEFFRDSNYVKGGPALVVGPKCKLVVLDSLSFNGFELAILSYDPAILKMKDLVYKNTRLSIAYMVKKEEPNVLLNDSLINREN
jgi:PPM family protein phosphatase